MRNPNQFMEDCQAGLGLSQDELVFRYAQALRVLRVTWASRRTAQEQIAQLRRGGKTLGSIIDRQCRAVLDATGLHHLIDEDGDGDWGAVWENVADLGADLRAARKRIADLEAQLDRVTDLFEKWAAEESEHRRDGYYGIAEGLHVAIEELRVAVHGAPDGQVRS
jgi:hypothetical protein